MPGRRHRSSRFARRIRNHVALGAGSLIIGATMFGALESTDNVFRASMATAYVALALLVATLAFGPVAALRGRRYPVSTDLRRDVGIWAGLIAIAHVVIGLQVHLRGKMWEYFVRPVKGTLLPRIDPFGAANYAGVVAALLFVLLLVTSNDASLRRLGATRWRRIHGLIEWAVMATLLHGAAYQWVETRAWGYVMFLGVVTAAVVWLRIARNRAESTRSEHT